MSGRTGYRQANRELPIDYTGRLFTSDPSLNSPIVRPEPKTRKTEVVSETAKKTTVSWIEGSIEHDICRAATWVGYIAEWHLVIEGARIDSTAGSRRWTLTAARMVPGGVAEKVVRKSTCPVRTARHVER